MKTPDRSFRFLHLKYAGNFVPYSKVFFYLLRAGFTYCANFIFLKFTGQIYIRTLHSQGVVPGPKNKKMIS